MKDAVTDTRRRGFFMIDNVITDEYLAHIGPIAFAVYCVLVRKADRNTETCFFSQQRIADVMGVDRTTVNKAIEKLVAIGLIAKEVRYDDNGGQRTNLYKILPCEAPQKGGDTQHTPCDARHTPVTHSTPPVAPDHTPCAVDHTPCDTQHTYQESLSQESGYQESEYQEDSCPPLRDEPHTPPVSTEPVPDGTAANAATKPEKRERQPLRDRPEHQHLVQEFVNDFWPNYPRKDNRPQAMEAYIKARLGGTGKQEIMRGLAYYKANSKDYRDGYIKYAQGWLNGEMWRAATETPQPGNALMSLEQMVAEETERMRRNGILPHAAA